MNFKSKNIIPLSFWDQVGFISSDKQAQISR